MRKLTNAERKIMYAVWNGSDKELTVSKIEQNVRDDWRGDSKTLYEMIKRLEVAGFLASTLDYTGSRSVQNYKIVISQAEYEQWLASRVNDKD